MDQRAIQHLYLRAGFGKSYRFIQQRKNKSAKELVDELFRDSKHESSLKLKKSIAVDYKDFKTLSKEEKKERRKEARERSKLLNAAWIRQMAYGKGDLREKMTFFWHDHFASTHLFPRFLKDQHNLLRKHALGSFRELLHAISKDPMMLQYLNNQQNKKAHPNENFAREVLELFTLGRGHYTENDIKEAARAFTGWGFNLEFKYVFRKYQHDFGEKTVLGKTGNFSGEEVLDIILEQKRCAYYISEKLYRFFVNEKPDPIIIRNLSESFYQSDYNVEQLLRKIFTSDWFYTPKNTGTRIKSPVEYLVGLHKLLDIDFKQDLALLNIQKILGQVLFKPPNVSGWPSGQAWIDSSTLLFRMKLPEVLFRQAEIPFSPKDSGDNNDQFRMNAGFKKIEADMNWKVFAGQLSQIQDQHLPQALANYLLQPQTDASKISSQLKASGREDMIKHATLALLTLPEFQLC